MRAARRFPPPWSAEVQPTCFVVTDSRTSGSKETAMPTRRFERIALAQILLGGCAVVLGLIEFAQAQPGYVPPPTPLPPPVLNPSNPGTVPQPSYRPITPSTPSTVPSSEVTPPANEELPHRTARFHHRRRTSVYGAGPVFGPIVIGPPPIAYSYVGFGYPCAWQRSWDGYWFRTSPYSR